MKWFEYFCQNKLLSNFSFSDMDFLLLNQIKAVEYSIGNKVNEEKQ